MKNKNYKEIRIGMEIVILIFFGIFLIPLVNLYYAFGGFLIPAAAAITAFILSSKAGDKEVKTLDLINIILAFVAIIPFIGYISRVVGIVLAIIALLKLNK